jgi:hypothetical protein
MFGEMPGNVLLAFSVDGKVIGHGDGKSHPAHEFLCSPANFKSFRRRGHGKRQASLIVAPGALSEMAAKD